MHDEQKVLIFENIPVELWNGFRDYVLQQDSEDDSGVLEYSKYEHKGLFHEVREIITSTEASHPFYIWAGFNCEVGQTEGTMVMGEAEYIWVTLKEKDGMLDYWTERDIPQWTAEALTVQLLRRISKLE
jgi:hypothetical protein